MAPQAELLIQPGFQMAVRRFHIAILVRFSDIDPMAFHAIVIQEGLVLLGELLVRGQIVDRRREAVAPHPQRHTAGQM